MFQSLEPTQYDSPRVTPNQSIKLQLFSKKKQSQQHTTLPPPSKQQISEDVQIVGERSLSQNVKRVVRTPALYTSNLDAGPSGSHLNPEIVDDGSNFKGRDSSTGGKLPPYGPRRVCFPSRHVDPNFLSKKYAFSISKSEVQNYKAICNLASSHWKNENAVDLGGVRCTFWSLGESMKPGGQVNSFVVAAFCYYLFLKPNGHPDSSKRHYFFP
uniref:Uncharacterized protein n=1 Tax=Arundo donax TaxID=35708 RepID=A0A0A9CYG8_ARUDO